MQPHLVIRQGLTVTAFYKKSAQIPSASIKQREQYQPLDWLWNQSFDLVIFGYSGYGYARKDGKWKYVDLNGKHVQKNCGNPLKDRSFVLSQVINESEWTANSINTPLRHVGRIEQPKKEVN